MTPTLVGFFGISLPVAIATDLIFATVTKLIGAPFHHRQGSINWSLAKRLWLGSVPGTFFGVALVVFVVTKEQTSWLLWPLIAIVLVTAITLGRRALTRSSGRGARSGPKPVSNWAAPMGGFGIGWAVALTSVGAGALGMALLVRLSPRDVNVRELVGTDLVHAIPVALIAGGAYGLAGFLSLPLLLMMLMGSLPGAVVGSLLTGYLPSRVLNGGLSLILLTVVLLLISRSLP